MKLNIFIGVTIPKTKQPGDTNIHRLNKIIEFMKGVIVLKYYLPPDPKKGKEPLLSEKMCRKFLQRKSDMQKLWTRSKL